MEVFKLIGTITLNRGQVSADLKSIDSEAQTLSQRMGASFQRIGDAVQKFMIAQAVAATAAIVGLGVAGVKAFAQFDQGMREVFTLLPDLDSAIRNELTQGVKDLSEELGIIPSEVVPALYQAISAGIPRENVLDFLRTAGKAAIGGVTDLRTAVDGLTSVVNAYGIETLSAERASDIMFTAVKLGKLTFDEFSSALFQVVPLASQLGVSFEEVSAWLAQLTLQGTPTSVAMTQIRGALVALVKDSTPAAAAFEEMTGKTFPQFIAEGGSVADALQMIADYAADSGTQLTTMFGRVEGAMAVLGVTGNQLDGFRDKIDQMGASAGATDAAFEEMEGGLARTFAKLRAWWDVTLIEIGEALEEPVRNFVDLLERNQDKIRDMVINLFNRVAAALQWFIDNGRQVAWSLGIVATGFTAIWAATHPLAGAIAAVTLGLASLVLWAGKVHSEQEELNSSLRTNIDLWSTATNLVYDVGRAYGMTRGLSKMLRDELDLLKDSMERHIRDGMDVEEVIGRWSNEVHALMRSYQESFPEMAGFVQDYILEFDKAVYAELELRDKQEAAAWATANAVDLSTKATYKSYEILDVILSDITERVEEFGRTSARVAADAKLREDLQAQIDLYWELWAAADAQVKKLGELERGTFEYAVEMVKAEDTLAALLKLQSELAPQNALYADGLRDIIGRLREMGVEGIETKERLSRLRDGYDDLNKLLPTITAGTKEHMQALATARLMYAAVTQEIMVLKGAGQTVPDDLLKMQRALEGLVKQLYEASIFIPEARDKLEAFVEYMMVWAARSEDFTFSWASALKYLGDGLADLARSTTQHIGTTIVNAWRAAQKAGEEYDASMASATERFIERVQREGKSYEEREKMIADAVAEGLLTQEEANEALKRMTDDRIEYEKSAIGELEKAQVDAAKKRAAAEEGVIATILKGVAAYLKAMAEQSAAMAIAEGVMAGILGAAALAATAIGQFVIAASLGAEAAASAARALAYAGKAVALFGAAWVVEGLASLAEGGLAVRPTLAVVGEGRHEEVVLPLSDAVFAKVGAGIVEAMGKMSYPDMARWQEYRVEERAAEFNFERMFDGATINVRDKSDVQDLAAEIYQRFVDQQRGVGAVGVIR